MVISVIVLSVAKNIITYFSKFILYFYLSFLSFISIVRLQIVKENAVILFRLSYIYNLFLSLSLIGI